MNYIASTLGLESALQLGGARAAVRRSCSVESTSESSQRDSLLKKADNFVFALKEDDHCDDDTASTCSSTDEDDSSYSMSSYNNNTTTVSFASQLVTAVHVRPVTSHQDKNILYYTDVEYRMFKREYYLQRRNDRNQSMVSFSDDVIVHELPPSIASDYYGQHSDLYYSQQDLKGFLEDFVASLNQSRSL
jgi:hypothetical protein